MDGGEEHAIATWRTAFDDGVNRSDSVSSLLRRAGVNLQSRGQQEPPKNERGASAASQPDSTPRCRNGCRMSHTCAGCAPGPTLRSTALGRICMSSKCSNQLS